MCRSTNLTWVWLCTATLARPFPASGARRRQPGLWCSGGADREGAGPDAVPRHNSKSLKVSLLTEELPRAGRQDDVKSGR
jgi:hypothetical protein